MKSGVPSSLSSAAARIRSDLRRGLITPAIFSAALSEVAAPDRDEWLDLLWDVDEVPADAPNLPHGCVPYLPCPVAAVLEALELARVTFGDVFVDVGSGLGRVSVLVHLKTGAACIGLEIQAALARAAQARADWASLSRVRFVEGDAAEMVRLIAIGTVFFLYCPFGSQRLRRFLEGLEEIARTRQIRVCCVDMPALEASWLSRVSSSASRVDVYRSNLLDEAPG